MNEGRALIFFVLSLLLSAVQADTPTLLRTVGNITITTTITTPTAPTAPTAPTLIDALGGSPTLPSNAPHMLPPCYLHPPNPHNASPTDNNENTTSTPDFGYSKALLLQWFAQLQQAAMSAKDDNTTTIIAKVLPISSCFPCIPIKHLHNSTTDPSQYGCPSGYSCTANVADPDPRAGCTQYCCSKCQLGDYCPPDTVNPFGISNGNRCPRGSLCATPNTNVTCPEGSVCLEDAPYVQKRCEAIWEEKAMEIDDGEKKISEFDGIYCPQGSYDPLDLQCPPGHYCPFRNGTERRQCEEHSFCPAMVRAPRDCAALVAVCPADSSKPGPSYRAVVIIAVLVLVGLGVGVVHCVVEKVRHDSLELAKQADIDHDDDGLQHESHERTLQRKRDLFMKSELGLRQRSTQRLRTCRLFSQSLATLNTTMSAPTMAAMGSADSMTPLISSPYTAPNFMPLVAEDEPRVVDQHLDQKVEHEAPAPDVAVSFEVYMPPKLSLNVEFEDLRLTVQSRGSTITILDGVSGCMPAGSSVAIMGESGAGKTSLLNVLCGRAHYGHTTGVVRINGKEADISSVASMVGFVPQDDIVHETLTVFENLLFSALFRSEDNITAAHCNALVNETLKVLLLDHVRDSIVGSVEKRGISGGQRKRVNIGLEIVAQPAMIFLDEPTSGLDATSSQVIMGALARLGDIGVTSVAVIHQPRYAVFSEFNLLFLLGKGGQMVYQGPPKDSKEYFTGLGFEEPQAHDNLADYVCDVTCNVIARKGCPDFKPSDLFALWRAHKEDIDDVAEPGPTFTHGVPKHLISRNKSFCQQVRLQFQKEGLKRWRNRITVLVEWALCVGMVWVAMAMLGTYQAEVLGNIVGIEASMLITLLMYCLIVSYVFAKTFTVDKLIFWRESGRDYSILAFIIANAVMDLLTLTVAGTLSALVFVDFRQPWLSFNYVWSWFLAVTWGISGYAYLFSILFPLSISLIITILSNTVVQVLLSGTVAFLDPGTMMGSWPLRVLAVLSTGYMACDSYLVSFGNQFPLQYRVGNRVEASEAGIMKLHKRGYLWYTHPEDATADEKIFMTTRYPEHTQYFISPLFIILINGAVARVLSFILLHIVHRGSMGKPSIFVCNKNQKRDTEKEVTPDVLQMVDIDSNSIH